MTTTQATRFHGIITRSKDDSLVLDTHKGVWFNRSRPEYDQTHGDPFPGEGSEVNVTATPGNAPNRWFVQSVELVSDGSSPHAYAPQSRQDAPQTALPTRQDKDTTITRLACLSRAVEAHDVISKMTGSSFDGNAEVEQSILQMAERFVTWVYCGLPSAE